MKNYPWGEVSYQLIETGFVDWTARDKTVDSIKRVTDKIPDEDLERLLDRIGIIFAPAASKEISIKCFPGSLEPFQKGKLMIYFPPEIEKLPDNQIDTVIATEFARVTLGKKDDDGYYVLPTTTTEVPSVIKNWGIT